LLFRKAIIIVEQRTLENEINNGLKVPLGVEEFDAGKCQRKKAQRDS
jgi:hypothetical protein